MRSVGDGVTVVERVAARPTCYLDVTLFCKTCLAGAALVPDRTVGLDAAARERPSGAAETVV